LAIVGGLIGLIGLIMIALVAVWRSWVTQRAPAHDPETPGLPGPPGDLSADPPAPQLTPLSTLAHTPKIAAKSKSLIWCTVIEYRFGMKQCHTTRHQH
jgi:hypothetical protein